jgi:hypothetical protein
MKLTNMLLCAGLALSGSGALAQSGGGSGGGSAGGAAEGSSGGFIGCIAQRFNRRHVVRIRYDTQ